MHADSFARQANRVCAIDQLSAEGALRLETDDDDVTLRAPYVVLQVVQDSSAQAYPMTANGRVLKFSWLQRELQLTAKADV